MLADHAVALKPMDVPVALQLAGHPEEKYAALSADLGVSASMVHASVRRLQLAGLLRPESRSVNWLALREFLQHGLRYAFPARPGAPARGVATAYSAPPLADHILSEDVLVWPEMNGSARGRSLTPLLNSASGLPERCPSLYELVALADAIRVGRVRERRLAMDALEARLGPEPRAT
jgi:hypothetical protein